LIANSAPARSTSSPRGDERPPRAPHGSLAQHHHDLELLFRGKGERASGSRISRILGSSERRTFGSSMSPPVLRIRMTTKVSPPRSSSRSVRTREEFHGPEMTGVNRRFSCPSSV